MKRYFLLAVLGICVTSQAEDKFFRLTENSLDTATVTYKNKAGQTIDLIGAIHVADKAYYDKLNEKFKTYDSLLYELVAPKGSRPVKGQGSDMHKLTSTVLGLENQLANIDYQAKNFVHADCSFEELKKAGKARGETGLTFALGVVTDLIRSSNKAKAAVAGEEMSLMDLFGPDKSKVKRIFAKQMVGTDGAAGLGPTLEFYVVDVRNAAAMKVVVEQLKTNKKLGLFYGAAHMPDFHKRLTALGFEQVETQWEVAWKLN
jgi:hypothetical protein